MRLLLIHLTERTNVRLLHRHLQPAVQDQASSIVCLPCSLQIPSFLSLSPPHSPVSSPHHRASYPITPFSTSNLHTHSSSFKPILPLASTTLPQLSTTASFPHARNSLQAQATEIFSQAEPYPSRTAVTCSSAKCMQLLVRLSISQVRSNVCCRCT